MAINIVQARSIATQTVIDVYRESAKVTNFLRSFFEVKETASKEVSIEVRRTTEKVAVDVMRGGESNRNVNTDFSQKIWVPPYYSESIDHNSIRNYDLLWGMNAQTISAATMSDVIKDVAEELQELTNTIERAYELQSMQALEHGIVTLKNGDNIDFKRKGASKVDLGAGNYWTTATVDPTIALEAGINFIRVEGKSRGGTYTGIFGSEALRSMMENDKFMAKANLRRMDLIDLQMPKQFEDTGATFHGQIAVGSYRLNIWTYPQTYTNAAGSDVDYMNPKKVIILPIVPRFKLAFGSVPQIVKDIKNSEYQQFISQGKGAYILGNYIDTAKKAHIFDVSSAGIVVPVAIDTIHTTQVVG